MQVNASEPEYYPIETLAELDETDFVGLYDPSYGRGVSEVKCPNCDTHHLTYSFKNSTC